MKSFQIRRYTSEDALAWNAFVAQAKQASFLFHRDFMEYHQHRFQDYSLIVLDQDKWVAVLPANRVDDAVFSHQGLTYGGLLYDDKTRLETVIEAFRNVLVFLESDGVTHLQVKSVPDIYHVVPAEELSYVLFLAQAQLVRRDALAVIDLSKPVKISEIRKRGIKKGVQNQLSVQEKMSFDDFWDLILVPNLKNKHELTPVHTAAEMALLKSYFPMNVRQFNVYDREELIGGTTIFVTPQVVHVQYIASKNGESNQGNLDFLFHHLMTNIFPNKKFFDFGCSNEEQGKKLNVGLSYWKESFGAGTVVQDFYELPVANHRFLTGYKI